ncbi:MAG TPA: ubiquinone-dependent pyruvate dehydrogenase [Candidatus Eisenbacteria bacterium]|nr:ubiquinone-dependent pyruvate dehydrogenase [Candidatus Eisenbacteria bacterium]
MANRVADELVRRLLEAGIERIYGVVGDSLNPVTDALRLNGKLKWIHVRHEETAAFAAGAEAQLSGKLAACAGSCGPGNLHLINGLFDAHRSNAPVLAIASHIPTSEIGTGYFQETHPEILFKECSHYCELITNPRQFGRVLHIAMQSALGRHGVGVIVLPGDVAGMEMPAETSTHALLGCQPSIRPCDRDLARLADLIRSSKKVALFCGIGCAHAHAEVVALAEKLKAPVGHSYRGKPFVEYDNPLDVGMTGLLGYGAAYRAMHECDLLLLLGTDFPYDKFLPTKPKIAQIDIRADRLGRRSKLDLPLWGDVGETIRALLPMVEAKSDRTFLNAMLARQEEAVRGLNVYVNHIPKRTPMHPEPVAAALSEIAAPDAIFTADTGMCNVWSSRYIRSTKDRRLIGSFTHGSMANALPQAIGAQCCYPGRQVVAMCGDGGLAMLMGDLLTLTQYDLPVKVLVFNNSVLGMVKLEMEVAGLPDYQTNLKNPNFAKLAEAIGMMGVRIENPADVSSGLKKALQHSGPALIDVVTDPNALSLPSHIAPEMMVGFGLTMGKLVLSGHIDEVLDTIETNIRHTGEALGTI